MKKEVFFAYLKVIFSALLFSISSISFANSEIKAQSQIKSEKQDLVFKNANHSTFLLVESELDVNTVLISGFKKTSSIYCLRVNSILKHNNNKTNKLTYNFIHLVTPSLESTKMIFPFHSFY